MGIEGPEETQGIKRTLVEVVPLTPELVEEFAKLPPLPGERQLKDARVKKLLLSVKAGRFLGVEWAKCLIYETNTWHRSNGQHSVHILLRLIAEGAFPAGLLAIIVSYALPQSLIPEMFDYHDNPMSVRNASDVMGLYRAAHPDLEDLPREFLVKVTAGISAYNAEIEGGTQHGPRTRGLYFDDALNRTFAKSIYEFNTSRNAWLLSKAGVVAEMFIDFVKSKSIALEFWGKVMRDDDPDQDGDARELVRVFTAWRNQPIRGQDDFRKRAALAWKRYSRLRLFQLEQATRGNPTELEQTATDKPAEPNPQTESEDNN